MASVKAPKTMAEIPPITNREEADGALGRMACLQSLITKYEERCAAALKREAEAFAEEYGRSPDTLGKSYEDIHKTVEKWAAKDVKNWKGKSLVLSTGVISFTTSPGAVALVKNIAKSFEAARSLIAKTKSSKYLNFLRPKPAELDKEYILAEFEDERITNDDLEKVGLKVVKPEKCQIEVL